MKSSYLFKWQSYFAVAVLSALLKPDVADGGVGEALEGECVLRVGVIHGEGGLIHEGVLVPALSLPDDPSHTDSAVGVTVDPDAESIETKGNNICTFVHECSKPSRMQKQKMTIFQIPINFNKCNNLRF